MDFNVNIIDKNGADVVIDALVDNGIDIFFSNPGTSEIHLVSAIDKHIRARPVLCLFEGVATGAADGYARASGKPAAVLLHLGPGLANGLANLHNAAKANSPMIVIVGDHATHHLEFDTPLRSDLPSVAGFAAKAVFQMAPGDDLRAIIEEAIRTSMELPRGPVVLLANTDVMWSTVENDIKPRSRPSSNDASLPLAELEQAVEFLQAGQHTLLLVGGEALTAENLRLVDRIAQSTGCIVYSETFNACHERGSGVPSIARLPYMADAAASSLAGIRHCVLIGANRPVAFFASPWGRSELTPDDVDFWEAAKNVPIHSVLMRLAERLAPQLSARGEVRQIAEAELGPLSPRAIWSVINQLLPQGAIVSDESGVTSVGADALMATANRHTWLNLTGGAIGQGLPVATGAAIGSPGISVLAVHGDGGAMYTLQSLWTQQREGLHVVNLIFRNDSYGILEYEMKRHGLVPLGEKGSSMFALTNPSLDWVKLANGMGMKAQSVATVSDFQKALAEGFDNPEPVLIEVMLNKRRSKEGKR